MQITVTHDHITTDGYCNAKADIVNTQQIINFDPSKPYTAVQHIADTRRKQYMMKTIRTPIFPSHMKVPPTNDDRILNLYEGLAQLEPMLQRNLGRIVTIQNIAKLIEGI